MVNRNEKKVLDRRSFHNMGQERMIKECVKRELTEQQKLEIKEQEAIDRIIKAINGFMGDYSAWRPVSNDYRQAYCDILAVIEKMRNDVLSLKGGEHDRT